ncbi:hypothetical protein [Burkholderia ubonensis]|uniref:hypothetical protein n=1 Tax=Burkholderia ubonensis TaxID=101571 RepID=UPI0011600B17|nr:hypothetical protein [Burkholderia ubonensis]
MGVVWTVGQSACHAVSIWFVRNGLELYFDTCWHGDCQERGKEMTPRNFRKWARAQGGDTGGGCCANGMRAGISEVGLAGEGITELRNKNHIL